MKNILVYSLIALSVIFGFSSCTLFGHDLQEDYDYKYTPGNGELKMTAYEFIKSRKDIDMGVFLKAIDRINFKEEFEKPDHTYVVMNDIGFVAYFQSKKYGGLDNMSDKEIRDLLTSLMLDRPISSLDLTPNPVDMKPINTTKKMFMWIDKITNYNMKIHYNTTTTSGTSVITSNLRPTNGVIHVVEKYPLN